MTGILAALLDDKPIPVAVVADQQDLKSEADAEANNLDMTCPDCGKMPCECNDDQPTGNSARDMRKKLMDILEGDNED